MTEENIHDLERIQKSACKLILQDSYKSYDNALKLLDLENLEDRRESLCLQFARKCLKNDKMKHLFPKNLKTHNMQTRYTEEFEKEHLNTERLRDSPIIYMQRLLNDEN